MSKDLTFIMSTHEQEIIKRKADPSAVYNYFFTFLNEKNWESFVKLLEDQKCFTPKYLNHMDGVQTPLGAAILMDIEFQNVSKETKSRIILKFILGGGSLNKAFDPKITNLTPLNQMLFNLEDYTNDAVVEIIRNINPLEKAIKGISFSQREKFKDLRAKIAPEFTKIWLSEIMPTVLVEIVTEYSVELSGLSIEPLKEQSI